MEQIDNYMHSVLNVNTQSGHYSHTFDKTAIATILNRAMDAVTWTDIYARLSQYITRSYILMETQTAFTVYYVQVPNRPVHRHLSQGGVNYII